jgi:hypothetical protein
MAQERCADPVSHLSHAPLPFRHPRPPKLSGLLLPFIYPVPRPLSKKVDRSIRWSRVACHHDTDLPWKARNAWQPNLT